MVVNNEYFTMRLMAKKTPPAGFRIPSLNPGFHVHRL